VGNAAAGKALKRLVAQPRPALRCGALGNCGSFGWPSSHAQTAAFAWALHLGCALLARRRPGPRPPGAAARQARLVLRCGPRRGGWRSARARLASKLGSGRCQEQAAACRAAIAFVWLQAAQGGLFTTGFPRPLRLSRCLCLYAAAGGAARCSACRAHSSCSADLRDQRALQAAESVLLGALAVVGLLLYH